MNQVHYRKPGWFTKHVFNQLVAGLTKLGVSVLGSRVLEVKGRKTGEPRRVPVNLLMFEGAYYLVSAVGMARGVPVMIVALFFKGRVMVPAIAVAAFFLLLNTSPLNAAVMNSVGAHIRATAIAVEIFIIHLLGDVPSPTMMGWVADHKSLQAAFILPVIAMAISAAILFYGMRFAPALRLESDATESQLPSGASS